MRELLKKIAQAWWKPYWKNIDEITEEEKNIRLITSKESWLWQFVCDKAFIEHPREGFYWQEIFPLDSFEYDQYDYQYRILSCSLIEEKDLPWFISDNIKI